MTVATSIKLLEKWLTLWPPVSVVVGSFHLAKLPFFRLHAIQINKDNKKRNKCLFIVVSVVVCKLAKSWFNFKSSYSLTIHIQKEWGREKKPMSWTIPKGQVIFNELSCCWWFTKTKISFSICHPTNDDAHYSLW